MLSVNLAFIVAYIECAKNKFSRQTIELRWPHWIRINACTHKPTRPTMAQTQQQSALRTAKLTVPEKSPKKLTK
jgi:hypothetical protein